MEVGFDGETKFHLLVVAKPRVDWGLREWWIRRWGTLVKERFRFEWREMERSLVQNLCILVSFDKPPERLKGDHRPAWVL